MDTEANEEAIVENMTDITHAVIGMKMTDAVPEVTTTEEEHEVHDLGPLPEMTDTIDQAGRVTAMTSTTASGAQDERDGSAR